MFAGPNGSGKSTIKNQLGTPPGWFGIYINPDDLEATIRTTGVFSPADLGLAVAASEVRAYFATSSFLRQQGLQASADTIVDCDGGIDFSRVGFHSYHASVLSDFLRRRALAERTSFTFETVMSSPDKVALLKKAQQLGYRTCLYYIATDDPAINVARVKARVNLGGHDVPEDKIVSRYARSLDLVLEAVKHTNRAYLFDNSRHGGDHLWVAEITDGHDLELKCDPMPWWFQKAIWDKIQAA